MRPNLLVLGPGGGHGAHLSPATLRSSLASVPCTSSSQPPDTWGSALCFWIFFSSLISSARNCAKALSPAHGTRRERERER